MSREEHAKQQAIEFFKWNAEKTAAFVIYLQDIQKLVRSNEIEENLVKFENDDLSNRYDSFVLSQNIDNQKIKTNL